MSLFVFSADGTTPGDQRSSLPTRFSKRLDTGQWSIPTPETAEAFGWYPVTEVAQPSANHVRTIELVDGEWTEVWTFDQGLADANAAAAVRQIKATNVTQAVATLRQWADDAEATTATSGNAVQVLNVVLDRLGVFFDRFADLVESRQL